MKLYERLQAAIAHQKRAVQAATGENVSERALAVKAGLSSGYFGRTKTALLDDPDYSPAGNTLTKLARALGVRVEWLTSGAQRAASRSGQIEQRV